jgi:hypothetical protein
MIQLYFLTDIVHSEEWEQWYLSFWDNDILGWLTVFAYFSAMILSILCAIKVNQTREKSSRWFWWLVSFILLLLGINKQIDTQTLILQTGQKVTWVLGFYEQRRFFQKGFMLGVGVVMLIIFIFTGKTLGADWKKCKLTLLGLGFLMGFVVLRGATFNNIFFSGYIFPDYQWILELIGIVLVTVSAILNLKRYRLEELNRS